MNLYSGIRNAVFQNFLEEFPEFLQADKLSKLYSSAKSKSESGLDNITEELNELDLLAVTLLNQKISGQKNNYFEKMNLYELPFEWDSEEINCLPVQCRRNG